MERMSPKQRAKFAAAGVQHPTSTFLPPSSSSKGTTRSADTGPDQATVDLIIERDGSSCVVCGIGIDTTCGRGALWSVHHRLRRGQHVDNRLSNLVLACGGGEKPGCHDNIHGGPENARKGGWLLKGTDSPELVPMAHAIYGPRVWLDNEGGLSDHPPGGEG